MIKRPAMTPDEREGEMISLAVDQAAQMLRDGTAPAAVVVHYLKLGSSRERLEQQLMEEQRKLLQAKTDLIETQKVSAKMFEEAIAAMTDYKPKPVDAPED